jgi:6-phosphogluconolactonase
MEYHICENSDQLAAVAAARIRDLAMASIHTSGRFVIALTGGSTPERTYEYLAKHFAGESHWQKWAVFIGDDRFVPHGHVASNFGMAHRLLLSHVAIKPTQIFPVPTHLSSPDRAAAEYQKTIEDFFSPHPCIFDLILLGVGEDGHTASLFPRASAINAVSLVTNSPPGTLPPPIDRITFTFPLINAARHVMFLASGEKKRPVITDLIERIKFTVDCPAIGVTPYPGKLLLYVDRPAAAL